jgi:MOSC domain-containing protein YiiM
MSDVGRVEGLWLKRAHRGPMDAVLEAALAEGQGLAKSVGRSKRRQVTILSQEDWRAALDEAGAEADPSGRRANILVVGLQLENTRGRVLLIGDARIAVGGELTPCERMEDVAPGLQAALRPHWRGGVFGQVLIGGAVHVGDTVRWIDSNM